MKSFSSGLSWRETVGVLRNDLRQLHKFPSFFGVFTTASALYVAGSLIQQLCFVVGEYTPETEAEAKARRAKERSMRMRLTLTDGERDLAQWRESNEARIKRLLEENK